MNFSSSFALLVSAIAGTQTATAIDISDFTKPTADGYCVDSAREPFTAVESPPRTLTSFTEAENYCVGYCGQNLPSTFRGFNIRRGTTKYLCECLFDMPYGSPLYPFPYNYSPWLQAVAWNDGTVAIAGTQPDPTSTCYKYDGTNTGTSSPTAVYTPAPTNVISDFTYVGPGYCWGSSNKYYSWNASPWFPRVDKHTDETICANYCGQNANSNFLGFQKIRNGGLYFCTCLFNTPGVKPNYNYNPPIDQAGAEPGAGPIVSFKNAPNVDCYKWNGPATHAPVTVAPSTHAPVSVTGTPTTNAPATIAPTTHAPVVPTPPLCLGGYGCRQASDCVFHGLKHCFDGCCIGSKSAKGTKSTKTAKRV